MKKPHCYAVSYVLICCLSTIFLQAQEAVYNVSFESVWSQETHPHSSGSLPANAHWSPLVGVIHTEDIQFLMMGELASQAVENIAEMGIADQFEIDVNQAISEGYAQQYLDMGMLNSSLGTLSTSGITVSTAYPRLTILSMIAPSPDWLIAVSSIPLIDNTGNFIESIIIPLFPYDAGTDSGADYASPNIDTDPADPISSLQGITPFSSQSIGTLTISLEMVLSTPDTSLSEFKVYPNPSSGLFTIRSGEMLLNQKATLYTMTGIQVRTFMLTSRQQQLDLSALSAGIYFLEIITQNGRKAVQKLVKY